MLSESKNIKFSSERKLLFEFSRFSNEWCMQRRTSLTFSIAHLLVLNLSASMQKKKKNVSNNIKINLDIIKKAQIKLLKTEYWHYQCYKMQTQI